MTEQRQRVSEITHSLMIYFVDLPELPAASGLVGALGSPMNIGILVSCILVAIILLVQVYQNYDKRLSSYKNNK